MELRDSEAEAAFRAEARSWLRRNVPSPPLPSGDTHDGFAAHLDWEKRLFDGRWSVVSWPARYGGRDASVWEWLIFEEEYYSAGAPQRVTQNGIFLLAPTLFEFGTEYQRDRYLPAMASATELWCQGWSEPRLDGDEGFAEVFFDDVFFPDDDVLGGVSLSGPIYAGTNEIQRNIIAERLLGLPRR